MLSKTVSVPELVPLNYRPIINYRVQFLKQNISDKGYAPACPLVIQRNGKGYVVVNGCHRLQALRELGISEVPAVEYPAEEDPVRLALVTQENDENVQPWDFLDKAFLVKKLYEELGTQEKVTERLGWAQSSVAYYKAIAELPEEVITVIRNSMINSSHDTVIDDYQHGDKKPLDALWSVRWFRHICSLPNDELKLSVIQKAVVDSYNRGCRKFLVENAGESGGKVGVNAPECKLLSPDSHTARRICNRNS